MASRSTAPSSQRIENATVVIDAQGNVHIEAKGYAVHAAGDPAALGPASRPAGSTETGAASPARLTRRYFLATEHSQPGTQYDLAIFINAQWIREVKASEPQVVMEITRYLRPGRTRSSSPPRSGSTGSGSPRLATWRSRSSSARGTSAAIT